MQLATGEWSPYTGEELPANGVASAIVSDVLRDIGYETQYKFMSWGVALERAASSETDNEIRGSFPYIKTEDREKHFYYSDPIMNQELTAFYNAFTNPQGADINTAEHLGDFNLIQVDGYDYPGTIKKHIAPDAMRVSNIEAAFDAIANSDINSRLIVIEAVEVGNQTLEQKQPKLRLYLRAAPLRATVNLHLLLSKKNPNNRPLRDDFNRSLANFKKNKEAFKAFQQTIKHKIDMARAVQLEPYGDQSIVRAYTNIDKTKSILLPLGSRAIVKQWDSQFLQSSTTANTTTETMVRVKLLNGPLKNTEYFVDGKAVHLP